MPWQKKIKNRYVNDECDCDGGCNDSMKFFYIKINGVEYRLDIKRLEKEDFDT